MRPSAILLTVLLLLTTSTVAAQTPAPAAGPASNGVLMQLTFDEVQPESVAVIGMVRTTLEAGGGLRIATGSGPAVHFVESGVVSVRTEGDAQVAVVAGGAADASAGQGTSPGTEVTVEAGSAFLIPPGATAEIRNAEESPATTLDLIASIDATTDAEMGVTHAVLVQQEAALPEAPVIVTLARVTVEPGDHLELSADPAHVAYATVERGQAFLLSGQGINRGAEPMEVYLLTISGEATTIASPAA